MNFLQKIVENQTINYKDYSTSTENVEQLKMVSFWGSAKLLLCK